MEIVKIYENLHKGFQENTSFRLSVLDNALSKMEVKLADG